MFSSGQRGGFSYLMQGLVVGLIYSSIHFCRADSSKYDYYYSSTVVCQQNITSPALSGCVNGELDLLEKQMLVSFNQVYNQYGLSTSSSWNEPYKKKPNNNEDRSLKTITCRDYCGPKGNPMYCRIYCGGSYRRRNLRRNLDKYNNNGNKYGNNNGNNNKGSPKSAYYNVTFEDMGSCDNFCQSVEASLNTAAVAALQNVMASSTSSDCQSFLLGVVCQADTTMNYDYSD